MNLVYGIELIEDGDVLGSAVHDGVMMMEVVMIMILLMMVMMLRSTSSKVCWRVAGQEAVEPQPEKFEQYILLLPHHHEVILFLSHHTHVHSGPCSQHQEERDKPGCGSWCPHVRRA